jgi:hypothetical protein
MNDPLWDLEQQLVAAARRQAQKRASFPKRPVAVAAGLAILVIAVPAAAAIKHAFWDASPAEPAPGSGIVAEPGERIVNPSGPSPADGSQNGTVVTDPHSCSEPVPPSAPPSTGSPPPALLSELGVLRRARTVADALPTRFYSSLATGVNPASIRLADTSAANGRYYLVPADNIDPEARSSCAPSGHGRPEAGVCLVERGGAGGSACASADEVRAGESLIRGDRVPGTRPGTVFVSGIVPDGVRQVVLEYPAGAPVLRVDVKVENNVFATSFNGSAALKPKVIWRTASGTESPPG